MVTTDRSPSVEHSPSSTSTRTKPTTHKATSAIPAMMEAMSTVLDFQEAVTRVAVTVDGGFDGQPAVSTGISYAVEVAGQASETDLAALVTHVDTIAEIPGSLRMGTPVTLDRMSVTPAS